MPARVCVIGSINVDLTILADRLPAPGETVLGGRFSTHDGGKGANQAVAAARAGAEVTMIGAVGRDAHGERALEALRSEDVDVARVRIHDVESTGVALIAIGPRGENQIVVAPGANAHFEIDDHDRQVIGAASVVITNHEVPAAVVSAVLTEAHRSGAIMILNPAPARALSVDTLRLGPILTPNEHELVVAIGNDDTNQALEELAARHRGPIVVTQGPSGALLADGGRRDHFPGRTPPGMVVDTTGAGDTFNGVLGAWLAQGADLDSALRAANAAAALSTTSAGAREGMPTRETLEAFLNEG